MSNTLAETSPARAPLVSQTAAAIRARIAAGRWSIGQQLPSEPQLATDLGISRGTLRESLRLLISNGLLHRRHGVGTFVASYIIGAINAGIVSAGINAFYTQLAFGLVIVISVVLQTLIERRIRRQSLTGR